MLDDAMQHAEEALALAEIEADKRVLIDALIHTARICGQCGAHGRGIGLLRRGIELGQQEGWAGAEITALFWLGWLLQQRGDLIEAKALLKTALRKCRETDNEIDGGRIMVGLARVRRRVRV